MKLEDFRELFAHMEWADARVWVAALSKAEAGEDAQLRAKFAHTHAVQRLFLCVWQGGPLASLPSELPDLLTMLAYARAYYADLLQFLDALDEGELTRAVVLPWAARFTERLGHEPATTTLAETLTQVVMHSTYHRGQVNTRLRELGIDPPLTDYIGWLWAGRPAPVWPDASS